MFRMIAIGFISLIGVSLFGLQGLATWKKQDNYKKGVLGTIELYKSAPVAAERWTRLATRTCLEDRSEGDLPSYYTDAMADLAATAFRFASQNDYDSAKDPIVQTFVAEVQDTIVGRFNKVANRMAREPRDVQKRLTSSMNWFASNGRAAMACIGLNVAHLAKAEK